MKFIQRFSQLITADAHAVLDAVEDPQSLLKQAIREMGTLIESDQQRLLEINQAIEQLTHRNERTQSSLLTLEKELDICFSNDEPQLARKVVKKKLWLLQQQAQQQETHSQLCKQKDHLALKISSNQQELESITQQAELLLVNEQSNNPSFTQTSQHLLITDDEIEIAYLNEKAKREVV